jgi:membrane protease YdiL (CAAX protease family)
MVGAAPYQFGWTLHQWRRRLLLGLLAWLLATPLLYAFNVCISIAYRELLNGPEQQHQLEILAKSGPSELEWALLIVSAVIVAPVQEELVFRGIMLPWANQSFRNADLMVMWTLPLTLFQRAGRISEVLHASPFSWEDLGPELQPPGCALLLMLIYFGLRAVWRSPAPAGIYASALIFGFAHALVWPSPVPLFFLGLILAALAYRTQGLLAPMVLHGLFNGVACLELLFG